MTDPIKSGALVAILPCHDLDVSERFYERLGFHFAGDFGNYRILHNDDGGQLHLTTTVEGWLIPGRNPFGLYLYMQDVDAMAARFTGETIEKDGASHKPWGMYEFALSDPDEALVRVGWPSRPMA